MFTKYKDPIVLIAQTQPGKPSTVISKPGEGMVTNIQRAMDYMFHRNGHVLSCANMNAETINQFFTHDIEKYHYLCLDDVDCMDETNRQLLLDHVKKCMAHMRIIFTLHSDYPFDFETVGYTWHMDLTPLYEYGVTKNSEG